MSETTTTNNNTETRPAPREREEGTFEPRQRRVQIPRFVFKKKRCKLCKANLKDLDYKDVDMISRFITERGKILPRRVTGCCAKHQRRVKVAVKRARYMALVPFAKVEIISK